MSQGAVGFRDAEDKLPMREDSIFDLASVSKQFTAAAIMLLIRKGLVGLEDEITKYFPTLSYPGVTVRHLLTHTSGLPDYMKWVDRLARREGTIPPNSIVIRFLKESGMKARFAPGEKFEYCNTGYCVLAALVEKLSGVKFEDFMRDNIFEPAGMTSTRACHIRRDGVPFDNFAQATVFEDGRFLRDQEAEPVRTIEELAVKDPDKSKWESFCGKYEKNDEDFPLEEVYLKDGELYAHVVWDEDDVLDCRLYPLGENKFGRKGGMVEIVFEDGCMKINGEACKKL